MNAATNIYKLDMHGMAVCLQYLAIYSYVLLDDVSISNNSDSSSDSSAIIGGAVGGVMLLLHDDHCSAVHCDTVYEKVS